MKKELIIFIVWIILPALAYTQQNSPDTIRLFYLGGQSNMDGYGYNTDLPESLNKVFESVWIFHGNPAEDGKDNGGLGSWSPLKPGHGVGFSSDGNKNKLSERFGVELSFGKRLQELYPNEKIAIVKYSRGGTSLDSLISAFGYWEPDQKANKGINQYDHFLATIKNAFNNHDINGNGKTTYL